MPRRRRRHRSPSCSTATPRCSSRSAPGARRDLDLPGHDLDGVLRAVEYLLNVNQGFRVDLGERVVVVGGGNVAFDAARTALRAASPATTQRRAPVALGADVGRRRPPRDDDDPRRRACGACARACST